MEIRFYDAFKKNNAPFELEENAQGWPVKRYLNEAYENYMDVSEVTGKKIRWCVVVNGKTQSAYGYYKVKPGRNAVDTVGKLYYKLNSAEREAFIRAVFDERFETPKEAERWVLAEREATRRRNSDDEPEKYFLLVWSGNTLGTVIDALVEKDNVKARLRILSQKLKQENR